MTDKRHSKRAASESSLAKAPWRASNDQLGTMDDAKTSTSLLLVDAYRPVALIELVSRAKAG
jgi:hypothetical protein